MPRERGTYRPILEALNTAFPDKGAITLDEAAAYYGVSPRTLRRDETFPVGPHKRVPLAAFARWMSV